jgi:hypothetical protein
MSTPSSPSPACTSVGLLLLALSLLGAGCGEDEVFTGRWRSDPDKAQEGPVLQGRVELLLGQYGEDVAGVIRQWLDPAYVVPHTTCPCLYLKGGRGEGFRLTVVPDLSTCSELDQAFTGGVLLDLRRTDNLQAEGSVFGIDAETPLQELGFERIEGPLERVFANERTCPGDPAASGVP